MKKKTKCYIYKGIHFHSSGCPFAENGDPVRAGVQGYVAADERTDEADAGEEIGTRREPGAAVDDGQHLKKEFYLLDRKFLFEYSFVRRCRQLTIQ